jgi:hypothetical protein
MLTTTKTSVVASTGLLLPVQRLCWCVQYMASGNDTLVTTNWCCRAARSKVEGRLRSGVKQFSNGVGALQYATLPNCQLPLQAQELLSK